VALYLDDCASILLHHVALSTNAACFILRCNFIKSYSYDISEVALMSFPPQKFVLPSLLIAGGSSLKSASFVVASTDITVVSLFIRIHSLLAVLGF
jgi:hypothetical protein